MNDQSAGILSKNNILKKLRLKTKNKLVITPLIDHNKQISAGAVDLRLNTEFIVTKRTRFTLLNPIINKEKLDLSIKEYQEKTYVKLGAGLVLHPNQFALGSTLEYIKLPHDLTAYVVGRSSWGRLGLIIATAPVIHPGFSGSITLELTNVGDAPIILYPGIRIAQLVLHNTQKGEEDEPSKYQYAVGPKFSDIHRDKELGILKKLNEEEQNEIPFNILKSLLEKQQITKEMYDELKNALS